MQDNKVKRAIELEDGLINPEPISTGKMGLSHDAPRCALWLGLRQWLHTGAARALFIAESQGECKEKVQKPPKNRPTITGMQIGLRLNFDTCVSQLTQMPAQSGKQALPLLGELKVARDFRSCFN